MSNNKKSILEMMWDEIDNLFPYKDTVELQKFCAILDKYKAMHKEEIVNTIVDCEKEHIIQAECYPPQFVLTKAEHYYNITFGGNNDIH